MVSAVWQEWSAFSANRIAVNTTRTGLAQVSVLDRSFDDTWYLGVAVEKRVGANAALSAGFMYDSSPVSDANRTVDLPFDENWTFSASYAYKFSDRVDVGFGGSLLYAGEGALDQTAQGVRVVGDFDTNILLFLGGTMRYRF